MPMCRVLERHRPRQHPDDRKSVRDRLFSSPHGLHGICISLSHALHLLVTLAGHLITLDERSPKLAQACSPWRGPCQRSSPSAGIRPWLVRQKRLLPSRHMAQRMPDGSDEPQGHGPI
jgi:hypothetical protein